ncbi:MAG: hypothetical protein ACOYXT_12370 [Bacteroidota bacterium]
MLIALIVALIVLLVALFVYKTKVDHERLMLHKMMTEKDYRLQFQAKDVLVLHERLRELDKQAASERAAYRGKVNFQHQKLVEYVLLASRDVHVHIEYIRGLVALMRMDENKESLPEMLKQLTAVISEMESKVTGMARNIES